ncbi:MAG TPA: hypothetical protein PLZ36_00615 [Armatimonadota bacterium]|nr:hypothetical protein [Armatimonadota bacterium]HOS42336.1 hypothetical protein [Armatimonadota bacterium]
MTPGRFRSIALAVTGAFLVGALAMSVSLRPAHALKIGATDVLKVGGVLLAVSQLGPQINHVINDLLSARKAEAAGQTKVVPIFSVGQGAYIGAAQVVGAAHAVQKVQALAAVEGKMGKAGGMLLIPISTKMPGSSLARVNGAGVSAIIDLKL